MTLAAVLAVAALATPPALGGAAREAPVRVDADVVHYAFQRHEVTFGGTAAKPVTMTRDDARLTCRRLVALTDEAGRIATATCTGDVRFVRGIRTVTCERATYDDAQERIVCEGNPVVLHDGGSEASGARLVYELRTDEVQLEAATVKLPGEQVEKRQKALEARRKEGRK